MMILGQSSTGTGTQRWSVLVAGKGFLGQRRRKSWLKNTETCGYTDVRIATDLWSPCAPYSFLFEQGVTEVIFSLSHISYWVSEGQKTCLSTFNLSPDQEDHSEEMYLRILTHIQTWVKTCD